MFDLPIRNDVASKALIPKFIFFDNAVPVDMLFTGGTFLVDRHLGLALLADVLVLDSLDAVALALFFFGHVDPLVLRRTVFFFYSVF
jgi:hypothetical protein